MQVGLIMISFIISLSLVLNYPSQIKFRLESIFEHTKIIIILLERMNYLKLLLHEFKINDSQTSSNDDKSPDESGEFQVIELDEEVLAEMNKENRNEETPKSPIPNDMAKSSTEAFLNKLCLNQAIKSPSHLNQENSIAQKLSKQYTIIEIDPALEEITTKAKNDSASTIQMDEYYMIVSTEQLTKKFQSAQEWESFYKKVNDFNKQQIDTLVGNNVQISCSFVKSQTEKKRNRISLNLKELNSILEIRSDEIERRNQYWNRIAVPSLDIRFKHKELANKKDPKKLQQNVSKVMQKLATIILFQITDKKYKEVENIQHELEKWKFFLRKILTSYGANDKQIGYSKGLQYIVLGILVGKPFGQYHAKMEQNTSQKQMATEMSISLQETDQYKQLQTHFKYLMFTKQLRNMYFPGTPKLYQQIQLLTELLRVQVHQIFNHLQSMKVDFIKLFINYYKTFLLYRIKNPEVIRKIMELLLIYGIDLVRILLVRIIGRQEKKIMAMVSQEIQFLTYIAESLVDDYFEGADTEEVILKLKHLFVLDIVS